jgi:Tfp pilus assembly protein PilF
MAVFELRPPLSADERIEKRRLIFRDVTALLTLFAITATLAVLTYFLFNSFSTHRRELAQRWLTRGRAAMVNKHPEQAVQALRSALEYEPGQRETEIALATALAAAGKDAEATAYFNTLLETEPGNGLINLELARLAAKQGHEAEAIDSYQRALDGTWQGDGYQRRLSVRLELVSYLLSRHEPSRARNHLLIAAGNAPDEPHVQLEIAGLLEQAQDPTSAFEIYRKLTLSRPPRLEALEGAGRTAAKLGRFLMTRQYLARALNDPPMDSRPEAEREAVRSALADAVHVLALYPSPDLDIRARAERILHDTNTARARMTDCETNTAPAAAAAPAAASLPATAAGKGVAFVSRVLRGKLTSGGKTAAVVPPQPDGQANATALTDLSNRWQQIPAKLTVRALEDNPNLEQTLITLVYDTEKATANIKGPSCAPPTGEDALLLQIAQAPWAVEQQ